MGWSAIAVTCKTSQQADAVKTELILRQQRGWLPKNLVLLCVEDPQEGLGSGGATLNALLVVAEHISALNNLTVVSTDILQDARILIMHLGRYFSHDPCGRAFVPLPLVQTDVEMQDVFTNFDALYHVVTNQLSLNGPPGVWVCSTDMLISLPPDIVIQWDQVEISGVCCISVPSTVDYAKKHGVYKIDDKGLLRDIIYKGSETEIRECLLPSAGDHGKEAVALVSGIVFFSQQVAEKFLSLHTCAPVDACTYIGVDSGAEPIQISLYFDVLLSMAYEVRRSDFVGGNRGSSFGHCSRLENDRNMELVRSTLWDRLRGTEIKAVVLEAGRHRYLELTDTPRDFSELVCTQNIVQILGFEGARQSHSFVDTRCTVGKDCTLINSLLSGNVTVAEGSCIVHCYLKGDLKVGKKCVIIGLDGEACELLSEIPNNSFIMGSNINITGLESRKIFCCLWKCDQHSISDDINKILSNSITNGVSSSVMRNDLLKSAETDSQPIPPSYLNIMPGGQDAERLKHHTFFMAKLFPVLHAKQKIDIQDSLIFLQNSMPVQRFEKWRSSWKFSIFDILEQTDHGSEFLYRRNLSVKVSCEKIKQDILQNNNSNLSPLYVLGVLAKKHDMLLSALDEAALACVSQKMPHICARVFSCVAEVLALMAGENSGLRSGPAANKEWKKALLLLERNKLREGITALAEIRKGWLVDSDKLIRAARHYERAEHIFVRRACTSVAKYISTVPGVMLDENTWLVCECPARIDLSGGWSDTPPICYENGGTVVNVALMIENKRPIGARVRLIDKPVVLMTMLGDNELSTVQTTCEATDDFKDYCKPQAQGALLKACFVLCEIVSLDSKLTLKEQLLKRYGKGIEIQTWSDLPQGSGLGTSSILAGAAIMALFRAVGRIADTNSIIHAVLMLEQMLTTGGGWQDQVGGMVGGIKSCSSAACLPLKVDTEPIVVSSEFMHKFEEHMKLIYTGRTRLARNMLQDVLRNWYAKKPAIIANCKSLVENAQRCRKAFERMDLSLVGECVNEYWKQKKVMAPGCEPASCTEIMEVLSPHVFGQTLAGAGGGGFLCIILKEARTKEYVENLLKDMKGANNLATYDIRVDMTGVQVYHLPATC